MKKYLVILFILISVLGKSQNIGDRVISGGMEVIELTNYVQYIYESEDSAVVISTDKEGLILAIDYIISRENVEQNGLNWVIRHTQIGTNLYFGDDYYFVLPFEGYFLIQVRNVEKVLF